MHEDASRKKYACLDHLSTEELESLLRAGILAEDSSDPEMMDYLLEVIVKREKESGHMPDLNRAREDFERLYRGLEEPLYPCDEPEHTPSSSAAGRKRLRHVLAAAVLAAILIALTCVPVFGHASVVHMVASWTAEQFHFSIPEPPPANSKSQEVPEEYAELRQAMEECGNELVVPDFPSDFDIGEPVFHYSAENERIDFSIMYTKNEEFFILAVTQDIRERHDSVQFEKNAEDIEYYVNNGVTYYIYSNNDNNTASWYISNVEYSIVTNVSVSLLKNILTTI